MTTGGAMQLTHKDIEQLRRSGRVLEFETVIKEGDKVVAINAATGAKRIVNTHGLILEGNQELLLD